MKIHRFAGRIGDTHHIWYVLSSFFWNFNQGVALLPGFQRPRFEAPLDPPSSFFQFTVLRKAHFRRGFGYYCDLPFLYSSQKLSASTDSSSLEIHVSRKKKDACRSESCSYLFPNFSPPCRNCDAAVYNPGRHLSTTISGNGHPRHLSSPDNI